MEENPDHRHYTFTTEDDSHDLDEKVEIDLDGKNLQVKQWTEFKKPWSIERIKADVNSFLEHFVTNLCLAILIVSSILLLILEFTLPAGPQLQSAKDLSHIITWIFVVELSLRYWTAPNKRIFFSNYWIDILSVLPVLRVFRAFRILRLLRMLRLIRAMVILTRRRARFSQGLERNLGNAWGLFLTAFVLVLAGAMTLVAVEFDSTEPIPFDILLKRFWTATFLFISGEIVGEVPDTPAGYLTAAVISIAGLVAFAVMVGTISASMSAYFKNKMDAKDVNLEDLDNHIIICGWDSLGGKILNELEAVRELWRRGVVVITETDMDVAREAGIRDTSRFFQLNEDFTKFEVLEQAGARKAQRAIVLADKADRLNEQDRDARTVLAALTLEKLNPEIYTCAELLSKNNSTHLKVAGVEEVVSRTEIAAGLFALSAINNGINFVISDIFTHYEGSYLKKVPVPVEFVGHKFIDVFTCLKKDFDAIVVGIDMVEEDGTLHQHVNPPWDHPLKKEEKLTLILKKDSPLCAVG